MKNRYIPACIMLVAGLICSIISIMNHWDVLYSLVALILVLLIFYCLGTVAEYIIRKMQEENIRQLEEAKRLEEEQQEQLERERLEQEALEEEQKTEIS